MPKAEPSGRVLNKVTLECNLLSIPLSIYTGTVSTAGVSRKEFVVTEDGDHPVGRGQIDKETGELLEPDAEIIKKIPTEYGPVYVEDDEIETLFNIDPDTLVVQHFQPVHLLHQGHYVPKTIMFVEPQKISGKGPMKGATKALGHLLAGMQAENVMAVCELTTRGVPKPCLLMPDGSLFQVWHTDALREQREFPEVELQDGVLGMVHNLIEALLTTEPLDLTDERSALIQAFADEKAAEGDFDKPEADSYKPAKVDDNDDFMAALAASVEQAKSKRKAG